MSLQLFQDDVVFAQRLLKCAGLYQGELHGMWTGETDVAMTTFEADADAIAARFGTFDQRTERSIRTLMPRAQLAAREFMRRLAQEGIPARIISGSRTYLEQDALFGRGRFGNPGPIVTNARGGYSNHNFGIAWDIGIFEGGKYLGESPLYDQAAAVGLAPDLEWGGHWTSFRDRPHYQLALGLGLTATRVNFEAGESFV